MKFYRWLYAQFCWATLDEAVAPAGALPWWKKLARRVLPAPTSYSLPVLCWLIGHITTIYPTKAGKKSGLLPIACWRCSRCGRELQP